MSHSPTARPWTEGLAQGVVRYQRCAACGRVQSGVRLACSACGADTDAQGEPVLRWHDSQGLGTVHASSTVHRAPSDEFRALVPYVIVLVDLDEGARVMGHADADWPPGTRVQSRFLAHGGAHLLRFARID